MTQNVKWHKLKKLKEMTHDTYDETWDDAYDNVYDDAYNYGYDDAYDGAYDDEYDDAYDDAYDDVYDDEYDDVYFMMMMMMMPNVMKCQMSMSIYDSKQKRSERTIVPRTVIFIMLDVYLVNFLCFSFLNNIKSNLWSQS